MYSTPRRSPRPLSAKISFRKRPPMGLCNSANTNLPYGARRKKQNKTSVRPPLPKPAFTTLEGTRFLNCMYPWFSLSFHSSLQPPHHLPTRLPIPGWCRSGPLVSLWPPPWEAHSAHLRPGMAPQFRCRHPSTPTLHPAGRREALCPHFPQLLVPVARRALDPPAHRRPRSPLASGGRPSPNRGRGGRPQGGSPLCPQSRPRFPDGARPSGGAEPAHSPDLFPGLPAGAPAVPPRRVTAAAPPLSWARLVLPTPAGSGQPRPRRSKAGPCFPSPRQTGKRPGPKFQFFISVLSGHPKNSWFHFPPRPSQGSPPVCFEEVGFDLGGVQVRGNVVPQS